MGVPDRTQICMGESEPKGLAATDLEANFDSCDEGLGNWLGQLHHQMEQPTLPCGTG